jgi:hypothetical protein
MCAARQILTLWEVMQRFNAAYFVAMSMTSAMFEVTGIHRPLYGTSEGDWIEQEGNKTALASQLADYEMGCLDMELAASAATIKRMRSALAKPNCEQKEIEILFRELGGRIADELRGRFFCALTANEAQHYSKPYAGWTEE